MNAIRNVFALLGLLAVVAVIWGVIKMQPYYSAFQSFDDKALATYQIGRAHV